MKKLIRQTIDAYKNAFKDIRRDVPQIFELIKVLGVFFSLFSLGAFVGIIAVPWKWLKAYC